MVVEKMKREKEQEKEQEEENCDVAYSFFEVDWM